MHPVKIEEIELKPFAVLDQQWALLVAGSMHPNPMTVSWGGMGTLWNRPVITVFVRPTRFTYGLLNAEGAFTLNFLGEEHRPAQNLCGAISGRDHDKWQVSGLHPEKCPELAVSRVAEAELAFACRVLASYDIDPGRFLDATIERLYPKHDYHRAFIGEVVAAWSSDNSNRA